MKQFKFHTPKSPLGDLEVGSPKSHLRDLGVGSSKSPLGDLGVFLCLILLVFYTTSNAQSTFTILHTNDTHSGFVPYIEPEFGEVGGMVRRNTLIQETRAENPNTILVDAGDFSTGTPYYNIFRGFPEIELMNKLGYDVVALGNHEFDSGSSALAKRLKLANFPIVCANYKFANKKLDKIVKPYIIINIANKKIGIIGLLRDIKKETMPHYYSEITFKNPIEVAIQLIDLLRNTEKCDLIIVLSHLGYRKTHPTDITDNELAEKVNGIDFIIGGHSHALLEEPVIVNQTKILQARKNGTHVGKLILNF